MTGPLDDGRPAAIARPDLHPRLEPLGFLVGRWEGIGALVYPTVEDRNYLQEVEFSHERDE